MLLGGMRTSTSKIMRSKSPGFLGTSGQKSSSLLVTKFISTPSPKSPSLWGIPFAIPQLQWEGLSSSVPSLVRLPNGMSQLGMYTLLARQSKSSLCGCFLCPWSPKQETFVLLFSSMDTCQTRLLCKQRQNKVTPYLHAICTLTGLPKRLLALCSLALGWLLVVRDVESYRFGRPTLLGPISSWT